MIYDWPVGLPHERVQYDKLPGAWIAATEYAQHYNATGKWAYHTGLDMNLNTPKFDADAHSPVYAAGDGQIVFAGKLAVWGMVICIQHDATMWTRYAHGESLQVQAKQWVRRGDQLCRVGNADGRYPYHLHYDMARIDLKKKPGDWPGNDLQRVLRDYYSPRDVMKSQQLEGGACPRVVRIVATPHLNVRAEPSAGSQKIGQLAYDTLAYVSGETEAADWLQINYPLNGWIMAKWTQPVQ